MTPSELNEIELVELPAHQVFKELGYETLEGTDLNDERKNYNDVLLTKRLGTKIRQLNPDLPEIVYVTAINRVKSLTNPAAIENNREFHQMLLAGVKVPYQSEGHTKYYAIKLVDFETPTNNDFLAVRQLIIEQHKQKRTDHILYVNGLPLVQLCFPIISSIDTSLRFCLCHCFFSCLAVFGGGFPSGYTILGVPYPLLIAVSII